MKKIVLLMTVMFVTFAIGFQGVAFVPEGDVCNPVWENPGNSNDVDVLDMDVLEVAIYQPGDQVIIYFYKAQTPTSIIKNHKGMIDISENDKSNISAPTIKSLSDNPEPGLVQLE